MEREELSTDQVSMLVSLGYDDPTDVPNEFAKLFLAYWDQCMAIIAFPPPAAGLVALHAPFHAARLAQRAQAAKERAERAEPNQSDPLFGEEQSDGKPRRKAS